MANLKEYLGIATVAGIAFVVMCWIANVKPTLDGFVTTFGSGFLIIGGFALFLILVAWAGDEKQRNDQEGSPKTTKPELVISLRSLAARVILGIWICLLIVYFLGPLLLTKTTGDN